MRLKEQRLHHLTSKLKLEYEQRMHGIELASMEANQVNKEMTLQLKEALHVESDLRRQIAVLIAERDAAMKERDKLEAESSEVKKFRRRKASSLESHFSWTNGRKALWLRFCARAMARSFGGLGNMLIYDPIAVLGLQDNIETMS